MTTVGLVSLGCAKNQVDSEVMLGILRRRGFEITHHPSRADVLVVNTCGFLEASKEESYATIREMGELKRKGRLRRLVVAGCLVQRSADAMRADLPEVDRFIALNDVERIAEACDPDAGAFQMDAGEATWLPTVDSPRLLTSPGPSAYVKISEGCDNPCAFCVIPQIRGRFRSRPAASLVAEARALSEAGVRELNLIAQDSTSYGDDLGEAGSLPALLRALGAVDGIRWVRLLYAYPNKMTTELMDTLGSACGVLPYLDVPLQHASKAALARMRRGGSRASFTRMIEELRRRVPALSLRTTFIVGFPGETEDEFEELRSFVEEIEFDHIGVFTYSHEPGAPSFTMADDVPASLKSDRRQVLLDLQEGIAEKLYRARIGSTVEVLVEGPGPEPGTRTGRAAFQAPEVDGDVVVHGAGSREGFVTVRIDDAAAYRLVGITSGGAASGAVPAAPPSRRTLRVVS